jgi:hypothetical protein
MPAIKDAASEFLANKQVAVTGVSRQPKGHGATSSTNACASAGTKSLR